MARGGVNETTTVITVAEIPEGTALGEHEGCGGQIVARRAMSANARCEKCGKLYRAVLEAKLETA